MDTEPVFTFRSCNTEGLVRSRLLRVKTRVALLKTVLLSRFKLQLLPKVFRYQLNFTLKRCIQTNYENVIRCSLKLCTVNLVHFFIHHCNTNKLKSCSIVSWQKYLDTLKMDAHRMEEKHDGRVEKSRQINTRTTKGFNFTCFKLLLKIT